MLCVAKRAKNAIVMFDMQKITYIRYFVTTFLNLCYLRLCATTYF